MPKVIAIKCGDAFDSSCSLEMLSPYISTKKMVLLQNVIGLQKKPVLQVMERADKIKPCDECQKAGVPSGECAMNLAQEMRRFVEESKPNPVAVQKSWTSILCLTISQDIVGTMQSHSTSNSEETQNNTKRCNIM
jgi:hypothetical protein